MAWRTLGSVALAALTFLSFPALADAATVGVGGELSQSVPLPVDGPVMVVEQRVDLGRTAAPNPLFGMAPPSVSDRGILLAAEPAGLAVWIPWQEKYALGREGVVLDREHPITALLDGEAGIEARPAAGSVARIAVAPNALIVNAAGQVVRVPWADNLVTAQPVRLDLSGLAEPGIAAADASFRAGLAGGDSTISAAEGQWNAAMGKAFGTLSTAMARAWKIAGNLGTFTPNCDDVPICHLDVPLSAQETASIVSPWNAARAAIRTSDGASAFALGTADASPRSAEVDLRGAMSPAGLLSVAEAAWEEASGSSPETPSTSITVAFQEVGARVALGGTANVPSLQTPAASASAGTSQASQGQSSAPAGLPGLGMPALAGAAAGAASGLNTAARPGALTDRPDTKALSFTDADGPLVRGWLALGALGLTLPLWALYRRIRAANVLDNSQRRRIYDHVLQSPGVRPADLARAMDLHFTTCLHHVGMLRAAGLVTSVRVGRQMRLFENHGRYGTVATHALAAARTEGAGRILDEIRQSPGSTPAEVARKLGLAHSTVKHHVDRLVENEVVECRVEGKFHRLRLSPGATVPLLSRSGFPGGSGSQVAAGA